MPSDGDHLNLGRPLDWLVGLDAFFHGIKFIVFTPRSWPHAIVPIAVMAVLSILLTIAAIFSAEWVG